MFDKSFWSSSRAIPVLFLIGAASYFLLMEHRQHLFQWLPFLILGLCPLMHFFMHGGHGGHGNHNQQEQGEKSGDTALGSAEEKAYRRGLEEGKKSSQHHH